MNPPTDIPSWLESLGLGELAPVFEENDITPDVLHDLTVDDLREMGITSLGKRKKLLAALAGLHAPEAAIAPHPQPPEPEPEPAPEPEPESERRAVPKPKPGLRLVPLKVAAPVVQEVAAPAPEPVMPALELLPVPTGGKPRRKAFSGAFLLASVIVHLLLGVGAVYWVVQKIETKRKLQFASGPPTANPSKRALDHKVSLQKKKNAGGSPAQARRIAVTGLASKITLPEMPNVPTTSTQFVAGRMAGMGGAGFGSGLGFGNGSGMGVGGMGGGGLGLTMFGARGGAGLIGTFYDLKQKRDRTPSGVNENTYTGIVRAWVDGGLQKGALDGYFRAPNQLSALQFMIPKMPADEAPKAYGVEKEVKPAQWVAHYKGKVSPPKSGTYHFVGAADDVLIVRFGGKLVLDGSWEQTSQLTAGSIYKNDYGSHPKQGFTKGEAIQVNAGEWYDIDVVIGERPGGFFWACLCIEEEGVRYRNNRADMPLFPLFRLSSATLPTTRKSNLPPFDPDGPIWKLQTAGNSSPLDSINR